MMLLVAVMGNFFVACSSSDDEEEEEEMGGITTTSIIGTWKSFDLSEEEGYDLLIFEKNGVAYWQEFSMENGLDDRERVSYWYNDAKKCYEVIFPDGEYEFVFTVLNFNDKTLTVRDDEGDLMTFTRVTEEEMRVNSLLVGKWRNVDSDPTDYKDFYSNGLGSSVDKGNPAETFVWMYNHITKTLFINDEVGTWQITEYPVKKITSDTLILYDDVWEEDDVYVRVK